MSKWKEPNTESRRHRENMLGVTKMKSLCLCVSVFKSRFDTSSNRSSQTSFCWTQARIWHLKTVVEDINMWHTCLLRRNYVERLSNRNASLWNSMEKRRYDIGIRWRKMGADWRLFHLLMSWFSSRLNGILWIVCIFAMRWNTQFRFRTYWINRSVMLIL